MNLEGVMIEDQQNDTLLSAGKMQVRVTDWFFFKDKIVLHYIELGDAVIHLIVPTPFGIINISSIIFRAAVHQAVERKELNLILKR